MSLATAFQVLESARTHLNDELGVNWPDQRLLPKLQEAHRELKQEFALNGIPVVHQVTSVLTVPANTTDLTTVAGYPTDLISPIWLKERQVGQQINDFIDMTPRDFIPDVDPDPTRLFWWAWQNQKILLVGSLGIVEVQLRYNKDLTPPQLVSDDIGVILGEGFLSYRTAALAAQATKDYDLMKLLSDRAASSLDEIVRFNVKTTLQILPARKRPYHRRFSNNTVIRGI